MTKTFDLPVADSALPDKNNDILRIVDTSYQSPGGKEYKITLANFGSAIGAYATAGGAQRHVNFTISSSTGNWDSASIPVWQGPVNASAALSQIQVDLMGSASSTSAPSLAFNLAKRDWGNLNVAAGEVSIFTAPQTVASGGSLFTAFNASTIDPQSHVLFTTDTGAETGIVDYVSVTLYYTQ